MITGTMNFPVRSMTVAPAGGETFDAGLMSLMRPFTITMVTSLCGALPVPSMTVAWVRAVVCAVALAANNSAAARIVREVGLLISIPPMISGLKGATYVCVLVTFR